MDSSPAFLYYNPEGTTQSRQQFVSQPPNSQKNSAAEQQNTPASSPSMPFPSALVYQSRPSSSHMKPQHIHAPTPIIATSVETLQKSSGLLTPSSPTLLGMDGPHGGDMYFYPPAPTPEGHAHTGLHTPINTPWGLDENCSGTITPSEMQLSPSTPDVWKARSPMSPAYDLPMNHFMSGQSSPTLMLSSCPSLSPTSSHCGDDLDFCDPRQLTNYPHSPHSSEEAFPCIADSEEPFLLHPITIKLEEDSGCKDLLSPFTSSFDISTPAGTVNPADLLGSPTSPLKRSRDDSEDEWDISSSFSDDQSSVDPADIFLPLSPPASDLSRSTSVNPPSRKKSKPVHQDAELELDDIITSVASSAPAPITPAPSFCESSSCSDSPAPPPQTPVVRRGRKQSLTADPSKTFACNLCTRRFRRQEHLKRHYRSLHTREKPFSCQECGKKFSRSDNLSQHARTHGSATIHMTMCEENGGLVLVEDGSRATESEKSEDCGAQDE